MLLVELSVTQEDNIETARDRMDIRYQKLLDDCGDADWKAAHFLLEVACGGFTRERVRKWFKKIGLNHRGIGSTIKEIQETVEKASHWIWLKRSDDSWHEK